MPDAWNIARGQVAASNPGDDNNIAVAINRYPENDGQNESDTTKYIHFTLPKSWDVNIARGSVLHADDDPTLTATDLSNVEVRKWLLNLPAVWNIQLGELTVIDPAYDPSIDITNINPQGQTDHDSKYVYFSLPKTWDMVLGEDSGYVNPAENASVLIDRLPGDGTQTESTDTKYVHIAIPNAWDIVKASDSIMVNPGVAPNVVIDRYATTGAGSQSNTTKYIHFQLPKAWNIALGKVELVLPNASPEVELNTTSAGGVISADTKYLHFKLPVAQEFTTDAFTVQLLGPSEDPAVITSFSGGDMNHHYPKVELQLPRAEKTKYGSAMAYTTNMTISSSGATRSDYIELSELEVGDFYINTTYAGVHKLTTKTSSTITTTYFGSMQLAIPNIQANVVNPYDSNGNPITPTVSTSAIGPVSTWNVNVDTVKAPKFTVSTRFIESTGSGSSSISYSNSDPTKSGTDTVVYNVNIPRGTRLTAYPNNKPTTSDADPVKNGDLYLDQNGQITMYNTNIPGWEDSVNIKGNNFIVKNGDSTISVSADDISSISGTSIANRIGQYIQSSHLYDSYLPLIDNEVLNVIYYPEQDIQSSYWIYRAANTWTGSKLTGDVSNAIVENSWQTTSQDDKAYSVTIINKLLGGATIAEVNPNNTIYQLDRRIAALEAAFNLGWGTLPITN